MNVTQIQMMKAIYSWISLNIPKEFTVVWADYRRQDRPKKPFLLLSQLTGPFMNGNDESIYLEDRKIVKGDRSIVISFLFYPDEKTTYDNIDAVRTMQDLLYDPDCNRPLFDAGIVVDTIGNLQNITDQSDIKYAFDLTIRTESIREIALNPIEQVITITEVKQ